MRIVLLGEQATGKSSLLVALYGALVNHRAGDLRLVRTVDEVQFLSRGLQAFGRRESVQRTDLDSDARLVVDLARGDQIVGVELPDRSGELLRHMLDSRVWDPDLHHQIGLAAGAMLFLRADLAAPGAASNAFAEPLAPAGEEAAEPAVEAVAWASSLMPADARTVDLLQTVLDAHADRLPLAIILSAWDRVSPPATAPAAWLAQQMPLLEQFLGAHAQRLPHAVFGVSAQGGDFAAGLDAGLLSADPWDRAFVVRPDEARGTLSEPVLWLLDNAG
jgi:double-GTPase-like protein